MSDYETRDHDEEENAGKGEDGEQVGIEADERIYCEGGESMRWFLPLQEPIQAVLKNEYYTDSIELLEPKNESIKIAGNLPRIKSPKITAHGR